MVELDMTHPPTGRWSAPLFRLLNTNPGLECTSLAKDASFPPGFSNVAIDEVQSLKQFRVQALACPHR